jgi:hypothetical protein
VTGEAKRGLKRTREEGRVGKWWHEKKVEHKCRQEAYETSGEATKRKYVEAVRRKESSGKTKEAKDGKRGQRQKQNPIDSWRDGTVLVEEVKR